MQLNPEIHIPIILEIGYRKSAKRLGRPRSTLFDFIHKIPDNLRRYQELRAAMKDQPSKRTASDQKRASASDSTEVPSLSASVVILDVEGQEQLSLKEAIRRLPYAFHPATAIYPLRDIQSIYSLAENIKNKGLQQPIELYDDNILHGRNRAIACFLAEITPRYRKLHKIDEPYSFVIDAHQSHNLGKSALACCAVITLPLYEEAAKRRQLAGLKRGLKEPVGTNLDQRELRGRSAQLVADIFGVSRQLVHVARKLHRESPSLFLKVHAGKLSLNAAWKELKGEQPPSGHDGGPMSKSPPITPILALLEYVQKHRPSASETLKSARELLEEIEGRLRQLA